VKAKRLEEPVFVDDIPPRGRSNGNSQYDRYVEKLKKNPGKWALYEVLPASVLPGSVGGRMAVFKKRGCETAGRRIDGRMHLYVRWPEEGTL